MNVVRIKSESIWTAIRKLTKFNMFWNGIWGKLRWLIGRKHALFLFFKYIFFRCITSCSWVECLLKLFWGECVLSNGVIIRCPEQAPINCCSASSRPAHEQTHNSGNQKCKFNSTSVINCASWNNNSLEFKSWAVTVVNEPTGLRLLTFVITVSGYCNCRKMNK